MKKAVRKRKAKGGCADTSSRTNKVKMDKSLQFNKSSDDRTLTHNKCVLKTVCELSIKNYI